MMMKKIISFCIVLNFSRFCETFLHSRSFSTRDNRIPRLCSSTSGESVGNKLLADLAVLEIRTGKIVEISKHPEAESLYVEKVDLGEESGPRVIVSGLVQFCSAESLLNRSVVVLCNLKPRALKGITSNGMLLCASNADHSKVDPLLPPEGAAIGELITFEGCQPQIVEPGNKATKVFGKIADEFFVNDDLVATFQGIPFSTSRGPVTSTLKGKIS